MSENLLPYPAFYAAWEVAKKHGLEARTASGTWYGITGDIVREMLDAARRASDATPADERDDTIDGLRSDLEAAVEVAYKRGATEWVRLNYPDQFKKLSAASPAPVPGDLVAQARDWSKRWDLFSDDKGLVGGLLTDLADRIERLEEVIYLYVDPCLVRPEDEAIVEEVAQTCRERI